MGWGLTNPCPRVVAKIRWISVALGFALGDPSACWGSWDRIARIGARRIPSLFLCRIVVSPVPCNLAFATQLCSRQIATILAWRSSFGSHLYACDYWIQYCMDTQSSNRIRGHHLSGRSGNLFVSRMASESDVPTKRFLLGHQGSSRKRAVLDSLDARIDSDFGWTCIRCEVDQQYNGIQTRMDGLGFGCFGNLVHLDFFGHGPA